MPFVHLDVALTGRVGGDRIPLDAGGTHHLHRVLRLLPGARVEVSDGSGSVAGATLTADGVVLDTTPRVVSRRPPHLTVAQALPKGRRIDEVVRQITELGVDAIVPVQAERCVARASGDRAERVLDRAASVARAAAEQARTPWRPTVSPVVTTGRLRSALDVRDAVLLVTHPGAAPLPRLLTELDGVDAVVVAVGPEGGWTDPEVDSLVSDGGRLVGLGDTVLRTEHAAAAAVAVVSAVLGRWG